MAVRLHADLDATRRVPSAWKGGKLKRPVQGSCAHVRSTMVGSTATLSMGFNVGL